MDRKVQGVARCIRNCSTTNLVGGWMRATIPTSSPSHGRRGTDQEQGCSSQILQLTWKSVGGTKPSRAYNFSSEAPSTFNMHRSPILAYFFELSGMSRQTFALAELAQVNSGESWTWFSPTSSLSVRPPPVCQFRFLHFSAWISHHFRFVFARHISGTAKCCQFAESTHFELYLCWNHTCICELNGFIIFQDSARPWTMYCAI